ncbi:hypothetical protein PUNSTDRAFT_90899 [Punctularia strigosozonata HHB-11173 SS5]|uniref:uncharacterized protein n=1 Tax=Punctularia strigosozonata (strain HHB-11173) TaxID=741275 RepID=UPI0004416B06|nr:uncharacterized protein PUNSTDRAFT_90899 [Punctularia strigosozonata HHB-11173 SS5]EIN06107.1 hypothetical protein PUNSTDRAFT_90899 [Punctularia strigosozonata HHB-11173 SS5]
MHQKVVKHQYPLIDQDPHASRVVRYMRPSDYGYWAAGTAGFPGLLYLWQYVDPVKTTPQGMRTLMRLGGLFGFVGGFMFAYQRSSMRFWGWTENKREEELDMKEMKQRLAEGKSLYGESDQPEWIQGIAARYSTFSQLKFQAFPWFNLVNHPYHGVDPAKYGATAEDITKSKPPSQ